MMKKTCLSIFALLAAFTFAFGQFTGSYTYDFRDGTIISNTQSDDGLLTLSGTYSYHSANYGLNMKVNGEIGISVNGSCTVRFLGSKHSKLNMTGTAANEGDLGTQNTQVVTDLSDCFDFVYSGGPATLSFKTTAGTGNDLYLPSVEIIPSQLGKDATTAGKNIVYFFDLRDGSIIPNETSLNGNYTTEKGLFKIECGPSNGYSYNGDQHGSIIKTGNKITLQVAGNSNIRFGGCQYSNETIAASSASGIFDIPSQSSKTAACYHQDGSTVDFLYVGTAGTAVFDFSGTTYMPIIEIVPVPWEVTLTPWAQKAGTITLNGATISFTSGSDASSNPVVTISEGTVISATPEMASIRMNLGGNAPGSFTPTLTGDIASVVFSGDTLKLTLADQASNPTNYSILLTDNSTEVRAEPGRTYTYSFYDGSEFPQTSYQSLRYPTFITSDGIVTMKSNSGTPSMQFGYHDATHGAVFFPGNSMDFVVAGNATITFGTCQYGSASDAVFQFSNSEGTVLGSTGATNIGTGLCGTNSFSYTGPEGVITATLLSPAHPTAEIYIHGVTIENAAVIVSNGKIDVWDFGAEQLDAEQYNNHLNPEVINAWYDPSITVGSSGNVLPSFTSGVLSWIGGGNDRLRTTNTSLTRYDENISGVSGYTGRIYVNSSASTGRYLSLTLSEDDEVTLMALSQNGSGRMNFQFVGDPEAQTDVAAISGGITEFRFVAKHAGTYHIFDDKDKPSYYRIYRKDATYQTVSGTVDVTAAEGLPEDYAVVFENEAGKSWTATMNGNSYSVDLPSGYTYDLSLENANGYIIQSGNSLDVNESTATHNLSVIKVELYTVSGAITGLGSEIANLVLFFRADPGAHKIFVPEPVIDAATASYSVQLEPGCEYTLYAMGVNDYYIPQNKLTIGNADHSKDIVFEARPLHAVNIQVTGLNSEQLGKLGLTFTNLLEEGYVYRFSSVEGISLRNGTYTMEYSGLDEYPLGLGLTSNLVVSDAAVSKTLAFEPIQKWSFDDRDIADGEPAYKGLLFSGSIRNEVAKGHLAAKPEATIRVPVQPGEKIIVGYYYSADFTIEGSDHYSTSSGSTSTLESASYTYTGSEAGYVTITMGSGAGTTYITDITLAPAIAFKSTVTVGADKDYATINEALTAVSKMPRENNERVSIVIDPGNYEEMLVITLPNITLKNAAAHPSIALLNKGVDIAEGAVRITSYYGHGYSYFSMGNDQKWNADVLRVNKENGYLSYVNKGSGTTNGSYWNATVVVSANGFEAENIIFENSFNQYISKKESEDVVVMWESGNKGLRPTDIGNTSVQDRNFVERAAALALANNVDKVILKKCRVIGRQDSFFGGNNVRVVVYKGAVMGAVDYLFGGMTAVFYKTDLVMNTSDNSNDRSYLTAAQQSSGRGYLMYECTVNSTEPGTETASTYGAKPGYFGRPWQASTSEVVFYNTTIETSNFPGSEGQSLIMPEGWMSSLGGESEMMYEFGTIEKSGADNLASRAGWSTVLTEPVLSDGTEITTFNFTKGNDGWDPIPELVANDTENSAGRPLALSSVSVYAYGNKIGVGNVKGKTNVRIFNMLGSLMKSAQIFSDCEFIVDKGLWIVQVRASDGQKTVKVVTR
ncbi:MAG TPA: pectinesterase family protein [Prolixibacteraceae bacterium]|nr:pectinesterase family protein [Prolixibacteraceae bacterium]